MNEGYGKRFSTLEEQMKFLLRTFMCQYVQKTAQRDLFNEPGAHTNGAERTGP